MNNTWSIFHIVASDKSPFAFLYTTHTHTVRHHNRLFCGFFRLKMVHFPKHWKWTVVASPLLGDPYWLPALGSRSGQWPFFSHRSVFFASFFCVQLWFFLSHFQTNKKAWPCISKVFLGQAISYRGFPRTQTKKASANNQESCQGIFALILRTHVV